MKAIILMLTLLAFACSNEETEQRVKATQDSLALSAAAVTNLCGVRDSLTKELNRQTAKMRFTKIRCIDYAKIVQKNPRQSVFIVGWTTRAFEWVK
jgi:hypothetical protein